MKRLCFMLSVIAFPLFLQGQAPAAPQGGNAGEAPVTAAQSGMNSAVQAAQGLQQGPESKKKLTQSNKECEAAANAAKNACVENLSPMLQSAMKGLQSALQSQGGSSGANGNCSAANKAQDDAKKGMDGYNADCKAKKTACEQKCSQGSTAAQQVGSSTCDQEAKKIPDQNQQNAFLQKCKQAAQQSQSAIDAGKKSCEGLGQNLGAGLAGAAELLSGLMKSMSCKEETGVDCQKTPNDPSCQVDCNNAKNDQNPICICRKNPRAAGCPDKSEKITDTMRDEASKNIGSSGNDTPYTPGTDSTAGGSSNSGSSPSGFGGGGGSSGGSGGLGKAADAQPGEKTKSNEILVNAGEMTGGASATSSGSVPEDPALEKYAGFLPKDERAPANDPAKEISSSTGLSNWEKVKKRYSDNRASLISK